jgi:hypothetical protein
MHPPIQIEPSRHCALGVKQYKMSLKIFSNALCLSAFFLFSVVLFDAGDVSELNLYEG